MERWRPEQGKIDAMVWGNASLPLPLVRRPAQLPLLDLAKETGTLCLEEMSALYLEELKIAGAAARGEYVPEGTEGAHVPKEVVSVAA